MTRIAPPPPRRRPARRPARQSSEVPAKQIETDEVVYGRPFWMAYVSNSLVMVAVALLYRYADFIALLGGTEFHLGWIVGVGMVGSLLARAVLGSCIDHYGAKLIWRGSILLLAAVCFGHLVVASHAGVAVYLLRILFCSALAGVYGASMTFITGQGPTRRMAELIGMLGTSGFLGVVAGTLLGDLLFGAVDAARWQIAIMFVAAGTLVLLAFPFAYLATRSEPQPAPRRHAPMLTVLGRYYPGSVLVVAVAVGMVLGMPGVFLRPYATGLDIQRIGLFFLVYAVVAIITRVVTRRWEQRFGARRVILLGVAGMAVSMTLFMLVGAEWQLIWPAIGFGFSHAITFPSVVAAGNASFPTEHRGLATLLVLAAFDVGQLAGAPMAGAVLRYSPLAGLPPYPTMFLTMAALTALVGAYYATARVESGPKVRA